MRMLECNMCGEPLAAATDDELLGRMRDHVEAEHPDSEWDEDAARETIAAEAYEATDS
jgi:predicted small metal-binding protein